MKRFSNVMFFSVLSLFFLAGCATAESDKKATNKIDLPAGQKEVKISSSRSYEECVELFPHQNMAYSFKASDPVDFNIHYHGEERVRYPVLKKGIREWKGNLRVDAQKYYIKDQKFFCLMWKNSNNRDVSLTLDFKVREDQTP